MAQLHCPYTTKLLSEIVAVNEEHILPVALGAPASFTVQASAEENSRMNDLIDAPLVNNPVIRFLAMSQGVVSRSGSVSATLTGKVEGSGEEVSVEFSRNGIKPKFSFPVDTGPETGQVIGVRGFGDDASRLAEQVKKNYAKKGIQIELGESTSTQQPWLHTEMALDLNLLRQEATKIAYLMTVRVFEDAAILSKGGDLYRQAMLAAAPETLNNNGVIGGQVETMPPFVRQAQKNEHALTCFRLADTLYSAVSLFGLFNYCFQTAADDFPEPATLEELLKGEVVVINLTTGTLSSYPPPSYQAIIRMSQVAE